MSDPDVLAALRPVLQALRDLGVIHLDTMLKVDVFVSRDRAFDRRAFERARPASIEGPDGATLPVCSAEDLPYLHRGALELGVADLLTRALAITPGDLG